MKVLLIIPAYNEEKSILKVYNNILKYNNKHKTNYDIIVINDDTNIKKLMIEKKNITIEKYPRKSNN